VWCDNPLPHAQQVLETLVVSVGPLHSYVGRDVINRTHVRGFTGACLVIWLTIFPSGLKITCKPEEFAVFNPPSSQTCAAWANDFVNAAGGYLDNPNDTAGCRYCQYKVSEVASDLVFPQ
jgi:hypothetical protein